MFSPLGPLCTSNKVTKWVPQVFTRPASPHFVIDFLSLLFVTVCPSVLQSVTLGDRPLTDDTAVLYLTS